ncbi:MAG TPA: hypothetical protein VF547_09190 [Allosphingosinicella sp.]|jgi:hypothetical protein
MRRAAAYLLTSLPVAAGVGGFLTWQIGRSPDPSAGLVREPLFVAAILLAAWLATLAAGALLGLPLWLALRRLGLDRRPAVLLPAGLLAGSLAALVIGASLGGFAAAAGDRTLLATGAAAGLASAALWPLLADHPRKDNG